MIGARAVDAELPGGAPTVRLLDAHGDGLDEPGLRATARALADSALGEADGALGVAGAAHGVAGAAHPRCASRAYRYPYALVACHDAPVGVDIERVEPFDPAFLESISTPSERIRSPNLPDPASYTASLWASKEALAKALGDPVAYDPRRLESPMFWPAGRSGPWRAAPLPVPGGHNAWVCWRVLTP